MGKLSDDVTLNDPLGPEFSVRIISVCKRHGVETVGQLREKLPEIDRWRGLGKKSQKEIMDFFRWNDAPADLSEDPEHARYLLEDGVISVNSVLEEVRRRLLRVALQGQVSREGVNIMRHLLEHASRQVDRLPVHKGE